MRLVVRMLDRFNAAHLNWALRELHPLHPAVPEIVRQLAAIQGRCA